MARPGIFRAQSGCSLYRSLSSEIISGSTHRPNFSPSPWIFSASAGSPPLIFSSFTSQSPSAHPVSYTHLYETLLGLRFKISTFSFFQPNSLAAEVLYSVVRQYIGDTKDKVVFDLYSGTGTIAQLAASVADEVIGVEIVEEAVEAARENASLNNLKNCRFIAGDVLKVLEDVYKRQLLHFHRR